MLKRQIRSVSSSIAYSRKGIQPQAAPLIATKVSKVGGLSLVTLDHAGPSSALGVVISSGSRVETPTGPGVAHLAKSSLFRAFPGTNLTRAVKETELRGNSVFGLHSREHIILASTFLRDDLVDIVPFLLNQVANKSFYAHEFMNALPIAAGETDSAHADPKTQVFEKLHQVSYRHGLGNGLFASHDALDLLKRSDLTDFANQYFTPDRIAIVGHGVDHADLTELVSSFTGSFGSGSPAPSVPSKFFGGEAQIDAGPTSSAILAIGFGTVGFTASEYPTALVLRALLDGSRRVKWGSHCGGTGLFATSSTETTSASAFYSPYSDTGLFGLYVEGDVTEIQAVASKALASFKKTTFTATQLAQAKKSALIDSEVSREESLEEYGKQVLASGSINATTLASAIESVTLEQVQKLAQTISKGKSATVGYGNLAQVPHFDEL